jgi:hypothetical protein
MKSSESIPIPLSPMDVNILELIIAELQIEWLVPVMIVDIGV